MSDPILSVVVPAYNNGKTLAETLRSILDQPVPGMEVIVADHASSDDTAAVMAAFADDDRVTALKTTAGGGASQNWNRVTRAASGKFLKLVCGDDVLRPGVLERQMTILESTGAVLTACSRDIVDASGRTVVAGWGLRGLGRGLMSGTTAVREAVRAGSNLFGEPASVMMQRELLLGEGGWCDDFPYLIDQATYSRVLLNGNFAPDPEVGAAFRMSTAQWSVALSRDQASQARGFHRWMHDRYPDVVSATDVILGNTRATLMAYARRASYWALKQRMG